MSGRKLPFRQKSEYPPAKVLYGGQVKFFADFAIVASTTTAENVQNKSIGIRLFRAFEHSNLEFQNSKIEGFRSGTT